MFTLILSLLGGGGALGAALFLIPGLRQILQGVAQAIPPAAWRVIAALALLGAAWWWHNHSVSAAYDRGVKDGADARDAQWQGAVTEWNRAADLWKANFETASARISTIERERHDEILRGIAADADALRLSGPGRAAAKACSGPIAPAGLADGSGGRESPPAGPDAPADQVPAGDRQAIVPWGWLVERSEDFDKLREEAVRWRSWYEAQRAAHLAAKNAAIPDPEFGAK